MKYLFLLLSLCVFGNFGSLSQQKKNITLQPHMTFENYEHFKRLTLSSPEVDIISLHDFNFEWGFNYEIEVEQTTLAQTLSDGTRYDYKFIRVVAKTPVDSSATFSLTLSPQRYYYELPEKEKESGITFEKIAANTYRYFDKVTILIPEELKATFEQMIEKGIDRRGHFKYVDGETIELIGFK